MEHEQPSNKMTSKQHWQSWRQQGQKMQTNNLPNSASTLQYKKTKKHILSNSIGNPDFVDFEARTTERGKVIMTANEHVLLFTSGSFLGWTDLSYNSFQVNNKPTKHTADQLVK